jgi:HAD superfamily hydrolase (TIGR01509 family)
LSNLAKPIKAVLLDIDGTVLNTELFILSAYRHTAREHGLQLPPDHVLIGNIGRPLDRFYAELSGTESDVAQRIETHRTFQEENLELVEAYSGAGIALETLRLHGYALAAVTSRSRRTASASLAKVGLGGHFTVVIAAEDASALKPDPAPLRAALSALGWPSGAAVMVGDTLHDIEAGKALGMRTIGARYGFGGAAMLAAEPTVTIAAVSELPAAVVNLNLR